MSHATPDSDYPLSEVPSGARQGLFSTAILLFGFTFFTATMFAGGKIGMAFDFTTLLWAAVIGNLLLGLYAAVLGLIACRSGLNSVLMGRFCFGEVGSKLSDMLLGFTQIGWYAWGTATIAIVLVKILGLPESLTIPLMVLFGFGFCVTAFIGYKGLDLLSRVAVPAMLVLLVASLWIATRDIGGMAGLLAVQPKESMSLSMAITLVFGTFVSGATQATNWTRFAKSGRVAVLASLFGFFIGNGLMIIAGAYGAIVYQQPDVVEVLVLQGLSMAAVIMLFLNLWTTQDNTIYNFAAAGCNLLRTGKRKTVTLAGAAIGTLLAIGGMYEMLIPFLILLGSIIPPIGGVIMADFFYGHRARYPKLADVRLPTFNWVGLGAYLIGALSAYFSPWVAPLVGIAVAAVAYVVLFELNRALVGRQQVAGA
ncbi:cytosine permease [Pseudomonas oleovorans]|uniref:Cytosine permease n=1 Tax=Ectopseudomonas oleovorans (strain CECT 5344) TaxID=1182590 RepID=W6QX56_ECTO5|nr:cytosine permease [Pseudomonas oleovorans]MBN7117518.1 cytosine permease [Pseudomonas oleovorans]MBN7132632.1 cytosine permease [Pseudomonas oleovorans]MBN7139750.1 cytosine permease [Pseudomonas oleovorans]MDH2199084.1 cytosine permease [Pseudomonas oleovorans]CDM41440.1 cytosine permease [Pseudomonas oleovorans CECT 5344]